MARLLADPVAEVAVTNDVHFEVQVGSGPTDRPVDLWERVVAFGATPADFVAVDEGLDQPSTPQSRSVNDGDLYQARLFREGAGDPEGRRSLLGKLDMPALNPEARGGFLTQCTEMPQIRVEAGGTYVRVEVAMAARACVRVQVGVGEPSLENGLPTFHDGELVATGLSLEPGFLHEVVVLDELREPETEGHPALVPGQKLFFVVLAWTPNAWDFVWGLEEASPAGAPVAVTTKTRRVAVRLHSLRCLDDSDELSDGEATFTFALTSGATSDSHSLHWEPMATGATRLLHKELVLDPVEAPAALSIKAVEDDSPASDDISVADGRVPLPMGPIAESASGAWTLQSHPITVDNDLRFLAEVSYAVSYH